MTVQGQQLATAEVNCIEENFTVLAIKRVLRQILVAVVSEVKQWLSFQSVRMVVS